MNFFDKLTGHLTAPKLTRGRIVLAVFVALAADALQIPFAIPPAPEIIDVIAMLLTVWLLGFHLLLLPTFAVELIPIASTMLPTWTACVAAVIVLRKRAQTAQPPVIDVDTTTATPPQSNTVPPPALPPRSDSNPS